MTNTTAQLTEALDQFETAFTLRADSITLTDSLADLNTAAREHIDWLAGREG